MGPLLGSVSINSMLLASMNVPMHCAGTPSLETALQCLSVQTTHGRKVPQVALFVLHAAEAPVLDCMACAEDLSELALIVGLAQVFVQAKAAVEGIAASSDLCLAVLLPLPQYAVPFMRGLRSGEGTAGLAQVPTSL